MATLREAVDSGRRWRWDQYSMWLGPGNKGIEHFTARDALEHNFEIEPEPEKPREILIHVLGGGGFHEAVVCEMQTGRCPGKRTIYHDAEACDRLHSRPPLKCYDAAGNLLWEKP